MSWSRLALLLPILFDRLIPAVEALLGSGNGSQKAHAVKELAEGTIEVVEGVQGKAIFNDPEVQAAADTFIAARVALANLLTQKQHAATGSASTS